MTIKAEGIWGCKVLGGKAVDIDGVPNVQINVVIEDGPSKGVRCTYEDVVNTATAKYVNWSLKAVGYKGKSLTELEADIDAWIAATGGNTTVEIKHLEIKRGKNAGKIWDKCNGLGRGAARPGKPLNGEPLADADEALRAYSGGAADEPPMDDDQIPFATISNVGLGEIASVLK